MPMMPMVLKWLYQYWPVRFLTSRRYTAEYGYSPPSVCCSMTLRLISSEVLPTSGHLRQPTLAKNSSSVRER